MRIKKIPFLLVLLTLAGCDVPGIIHIVNRSPGTAYYIFEIADGDVVRSDTIKIPNTRKKNEANIMFGFAYRFMDESIEAYAAKIKRLEIISLTDTIRLSGKDEIARFFKKRRRGTLTNKIHIRIQ